MLVPYLEPLIEIKMKHIELGKRGETIARAFVLENQMQVLTANFRWRKQEIDLIVQDQDDLVIIEVKTRQHDSYGAPETSVNKVKQRNLIKAANAYVQENQLDLDVRFDVISIIHNAYETRIDHIKNAFYPTL